MFEFNVMFVFSVYLFMHILVFQCESALPEHRCQQFQTINGQARLILVHGVIMAKITCFHPYVLINGNETMICVGGKWDSEFPICAKLSSCHDNCGKISDGVSCSCDWSCHDNNNCCPDIQIKCPYTKPIDDIARLYLTNTTPTTMPTSEKNKILNVLMNRTRSNSTDIGSTLNPTLNGLITRRSPNIVDNLNNTSIFSNKNLTDIVQPTSDNSAIPLKHNQTFKANLFSSNNFNGLPAVATESNSLLENLKLNKIAGLFYVYDVIYIIGYLAAIGIILFIVKLSFYFIKSLIKKPTDVKDLAFAETTNEEFKNIGLISNL